MSNLNQSVLDAAMHSVGLEKTNNKNDITVLENNTVRVLGNYKKTVEVDKEKHKVRVTEHKTGEFTDMDTLTNTKKTELTTKFNSSKDAITTAVRNNVNELKTSATGNINAIIAMQDAIGADSLINTTVAKSIAVGNTDGILIGEEIIKKDEFVLGLPDGCIFAVNYMEGDITDVINDNSPDGIESVKAYTGTGTFDNADDSLCGQMIIGEGCWFGIGSENIFCNKFNLVRVHETFNHTLDVDGNIIVRHLLNSESFINNRLGIISRAFLPYGGVAYIHQYFKDIPVNILYTYIKAFHWQDTQNIYPNMYTSKISYTRYGDYTDTEYYQETHFENIKNLNKISKYRYQLEYGIIPTPFILNKRKQTEITYQDILEEV